MINENISNSPQGEWKSSSTHIFWGEIAPLDHLVQIYETDKVFLDALEGFVSNGFSWDDCVIVIATRSHLDELNERLRADGFDIDTLTSRDLYIPLNAEETLEKFKVNGWPDEAKFNEMVTSIIARAYKNNRKVRAFGEMVALLWAQGHSGATVQLEHLWNKFCEQEKFCLFCAYPKSGFTQDAHTSMGHICSAHSKILAGFEGPSNQVFYKVG